MKICYLINNIDPKNGGGRFARDLIYGVRDAGHRVLILKEIDDGYEGFPVLKRGHGLFFSALKVKKFIKDYDLIHALDGYPYGVIAALANFGLWEKLIITVQGTYGVAPLYNWKTSWILKWSYKNAASLVAISNYTKNEILKKIKLKNIDIINHGINFEKFYAERKKTNENFILSVGALKYRKGFHISIPAFALVKDKILDLRYKIVGDQSDNNYFQKLKDLAKNYKVINDIEFLENISDEELKDLYSKAKLFILTSVNHNHHFEGFGLVFLEAAAAGLPVIGTLGNGIEDAVQNGVNGILVPQNDIQNTAQAIIDILFGKEKWQKMSEESYKFAKEHNLNNTIEKYLSIYKIYL